VTPRRAVTTTPQPAAGRTDPRTAPAEEDDDAIEELDDEYNQLIPLDETLVERFETALQHNPEDFAPVS
jgi:hypothetical protein